MPADQTIIDRICIVFEQIERELAHIHVDRDNPPPAPVWLTDQPHPWPGLGHQIQVTATRRDLTRQIFAVGEKVRRGQPFDRTELELLDLAGWIDDLPGTVTTRAQFVGTAE